MDHSTDKQEEEASSPVIPGLVSHIQSCYARAKHERLVKENKWLDSYRNYRGQYGPRVTFNATQSKIFVKITKTKVIAAYGQIIDVLFGTNSFPLTIEPTSKPINIAEFVHADLKDMGQPETPEPAAPSGPNYGYPGDGNDLPPGATSSSLLGGLENSDKYKALNVKEGPAMDKLQQVQFEPAAEAAHNMQKVIYDQLEETQAQSALRTMIFEMVLLGTGVLKGPFNYRKIYHNWEKGESGSREYRPKMKLMPRLENVSIWNFYPDPSALSITDAAWVIERHRMTPSKMRDLLNRPLFNKQAIRNALANGPNYTKLHFEDQIRGNTDQQETEASRYEVLEYWGVVDKALLEEIGLDVSDVDELDEVQVNVWTCNDEILRVVVNPFTPARIPYLACPYEIDPYVIWGVSLPENMEDSQDMMNGHARMAVDNLKLAGNLVFDIDESALVPGQDMKIEAGKIFRRQSGQPGQAVYGIKFPSTANENMQIFDKFRQLADEETGMPSYSHGQTGVSGTTRTAAGMSMLMGAAALNIKTVVKNIDDYLLRPLGEALYQWNMQFNEEDMDIRGDLEVKARGTMSLMQKEVRSQRLTMLMNVGSNPQLAPFIKWHTVLKEFALSADIDPDKMIASPEEAAIYARIVGMQNAVANGQGPTPAGEQPGMGGPPEMAGGSAPTDPTGVGGGTIGTGSVPQVGEDGFSASNTGASAKG